MPDFKSYYKAMVIGRRSRQGLVRNKAATAKSVFENLMQCLEPRGGERLKEGILRHLKIGYNQEVLSDI